MFDRKHPDKKIVKTLRSYGRLRLSYFNQSEKYGYSCSENFYGVASTALSDLHFRIKEYNNEKKIFIDLGCGESPDCALAKKYGFKKTIGIDLMDTDNKIGMDRFFKADIVERIPVRSDSVDFAICQAVIDLVKPEERILVYKEIYRILKEEGFVSIYFQSLSEGYGFKLREEVKKLESVGLKKTYYCCGNNLIFKK